jgi:tetratricopeptide (TPR) repeat protein
MTTEENGNPVERCRRQVELHPDSAKAHFNLGLAQSKRGAVVPAEEAYRKALELDPDLVEAWVNLGGVRMLRWDFKGALEANREALLRDPNSLLAHYNAGQACLFLGDAEGVEKANRRVIELDPQHGAGHYYLAVGLLPQGKLREAREAVSRAQALGHSPAPEFLRALHDAEKKDGNQHSQGVIQRIGADAPQEKNRRE